MKKKSASKMAVLLSFCASLLAFSSHNTLAQSSGLYGGGYGGSENRYGFGIASVGGLNAALTSLAGVWEMNKKNSVHAYLAIPTASPFEFTVAGAYKHVVASSGRAGVHLGGGLALGSLSTGNNSDFLFNIAGIAGIQVGFPGADNVSIHFDGGPALRVLGDDTDFGVGAFSGLLGMSVIYLF